jgi:peptidoglycan-associated lipoprotein
MHPTTTHARRWALTLLLLGAAAVAGCAKKAITPAPQAPAPPPAAAPATPAPAPAPAPPPAPQVQASDFGDVYFEFDRSELSPEARETLDRSARLLRDHASLSVTLEGHCDERGTVEYNLALGQRRADAARDYLVGAGVPASRVQTVSYGKERPVCTDHAESCWSKNRRVHTVMHENPAS